MNPLKAGYKPEQLQGLYQQIDDRFHALPGVERVGLTIYTPLEGDIWSYYVYVQGQRAPDPGQEVTAIFNRASPDYFKAVGQRVVRGRSFTPSDTRNIGGRCRGQPDVCENALQARRRPHRATFRCVGYEILRRLQDRGRGGGYKV